MVLILKKDDSKNDLEHDRDQDKSGQDKKKNLNEDKRYEQFRVYSRWQKSR